MKKQTKIYIIITVPILLYFTYVFIAGIAFGVSNRTRSFHFAAQMEKSVNMQQVFKRLGINYYDMHIMDTFNYVFYLDKEITYIPEEIQQFIYAHEHLTYRYPAIIQFRVQVKDKYPLSPYSENSVKCFEKCYFKWNYILPAQC